MAAVASRGRSQASVLVTCERCGEAFELATRSVQRARSEGRELKCASCRRPDVKLTPAEAKRFRRWWLEESGLSRAELAEIAVGLG